jgi:hypothetical protein
MQQANLLFQLGFVCGVGGRGDCAELEMKVM